MRLPHPLIDAPFFQFKTLQELERALGAGVPPHDLEEVRRLAALALPAIPTRPVLATIFGINPGLVWSFEGRPERHYRRFEIPKGRGVRVIFAPRVALKIVQKWIGISLQKAFIPANHVFGFVPTRSHVHAAAEHVGSTWVYSVDIEDFFPTTSTGAVVASLESLGYSRDSAEFISRLTCLHGGLAQGAPSSPVLSNLCFRQLDAKLREIANRFELRLTRYADDIVFSGLSEFPNDLPKLVAETIGETQWRIAERKTEFARLPARLKVHGLLVHGQTARLTKGYRNRLRAFRHLLATDAVRPSDIRKLKGHVAYGNFVANLAGRDAD